MAVPNVKKKMIILSLIPRWKFYDPVKIGKTLGISSSERVGPNKATDSLISVSLS